MKLSQWENMYQLTFLPTLLPVNCYIVEEENELTLVDTGLPYSDKAILQTASELGKPITRIVITHAHEDHVGALDKLKRRLPDAQVYMSSRDVKLLKGDRSLENDEPNTPIRGGLPKNVSTMPDVLLKEGDEIGSLVTIETRGHTPGSLSFLDQRSKALIVGDALQTRGGTAVAGTFKWVFPFPAFATWSREEAIKSAEKLLQYEPSLLAPGHGNVVESPMEAMKKAIEEAKLRG